MPLLPQELSGPQEGLRMLELPSLVGGNTSYDRENRVYEGKGADAIAGGYQPQHCTTG